MVSARAFVGWYNGLPENRGVSLGSVPSASSSTAQPALGSHSWGKGQPQAWEAASEMRCEASGWLRGEASGKMG